MKITKSQLQAIIKEEVSKLFEVKYVVAKPSQPLEKRFLQARKAGKMGEFGSMEDAAVFGDKNYGDFLVRKYGGEVQEKPEDTLNEDGHDDLPSAVRKLKTAMEDAHEILAGLQHHQGELPAWWMSKVTIAADYLNKARDYFLVSGEVMEEEKEYVSSFYTAKEKRAKELKDKGVEPDLAFAIADDQMEKAGKKIKAKKR